MSLLRRTSITFALLIFFALAASACSDDDANDTAAQLSSNSTSSNTEFCKTLDLLRADIDSLQQAARAGNVSGATSAIDSAKDHATQLREDAKDHNVDDATAQSVQDLVQAVEGVQTTIRQAGQSGSSALGVLQQLLIEVPAIARSLASLRTSAGCA